MLGDRKLSVLPVAVSLMTSCTSGLSLLGCSDEFYYQGPSYAFIAVAILLSGPITAYTILPVFHRMNELSLYKVSQLTINKQTHFVGIDLKCCNLLLNVVESCQVNQRRKLIGHKISFLLSYFLSFFPHIFFTFFQIPLSTFKLDMEILSNL